MSKPRQILLANGMSLVAGPRTVTVENKRGRPIITFPLTAEQARTLAEAVGQSNAPPPVSTTSPPLPMSPRVAKAITAEREAARWDR